MDRFAEALLSRQANSALPLEDDWFAPLLGDWEFDYQDRGGRRLQGEWYFRRALDGMAIEDLFICPSRDTREENPQPDGEYGAAVRMYNRERRCYDVTYICSKGTTRLEVRKEGGVIACTVLEEPSNQWRFVEVTEDTFHWQNVTKQAEGLQVNCEVFARRIQ